MAGQRVVVRETDLDAPVERVWEAILQPGTMLYVLRGLFGFPSLAGRFDPLYEGERGSGWLLFAHVIPFAKWTIHVVRVDAATHTIATNEHGGMLRTWNHTLQADAISPNRTRYRDTIEVNAGPLTPIAGMVVGGIFSYRQRRLRRFARRHLQPQPA